VKVFYSYALPLVVESTWFYFRVSFLEKDLIGKDSVGQRWANIDENSHDCDCVMKACYYFRLISLDCYK
jgi:hypothetical protein